MRDKIKRGEIYYANLDPVVGSEQGGERPVVILQNNRGNRYSPTVVVAAITSRLLKKNLPTHVRLEKTCLAEDSLVLLEQIRTIDKSRLLGYVGVLSDADMERINIALFVSVGTSLEAKDGA